MKLFFSIFFIFYAAIFSSVANAQCGQLWEINKGSMGPSPGEVLAKCSGKFQLIYLIYQRQYDAGSRSQDLIGAIGDFKQATMRFGGAAAKFISPEEVAKIRDQETQEQSNNLAQIGHGLTPAAATAKVDAWVRRSTTECDTSYKNLKMAFGACKGF